MKIKQDELSTGFKIILTLARTLLEKPQILLLDEINSNLNQKTEAKILNILDFFFENVTVLFITHKLNGLKNFDRMFIMDNGCLTIREDID